MKVGMNKCSEANSSSTALLDSLPILTLALQLRATPAGRRSSSSRTEKEDILSGFYVKSSHLNLYSTYPIALHCVRTVPGLRVHSYTTARPVYHIAQCTTRRHICFVRICDSAESLPKCPWLTSWASLLDYASIPVSHRFSRATSLTQHSSHVDFILLLLLHSFSCRRLLLLLLVQV